MAAQVESAPEPSFNLDRILAELGSFGKYQLLLLLLLAFRDSFLAMCNFNYVFTAADVKFRCVAATWDEGDRLDWNASDVCPAAALSSEPPCDRRVYENYNSIVAEFDLGCEGWKAPLVGTVHNVGLLVSCLFSGFVADRYGRKVVIVGTPLMVGVLGLVKSFSINYWMLLVLEFCETALGYGNASMVLSLEAVSHQSRVAFSCISDVLSSFGSAFFGLIAWGVPYWRDLMRAVYAPLLAVLFYTFLVDEGVRWLLARDRRSEAARILRKVAKFNDVTLSATAKEMMRAISEEKRPQEAKAKQGAGGEGGGADDRGAGDLRAVLHSRRIWVRVATIAACFSAALFVYNGALVNAASISGERHLNVSLMLLVSVPTRLVSVLTLHRFGRRLPICVAYCFCALFFFSSAFVPKSVPWAQPCLYLCGKMCNSFGLFALTVFAMEVFPTTARSSLTSIANTIGRLGAVLAPQTPLLTQYLPGLPSIVFGMAALCPAALVLLLPEPGGSRLPDDLRDAERLDEAEKAAATAEDASPKKAHAPAVPLPTDPSPA